VLFQTLDERIEALSIGRPERLNVLIQETQLHKGGHDVRCEVAQAAATVQDTALLAPLYNFGRGRHPTQSQSRRKNLGKRSQPDNARLGRQMIHRRRRRALIPELVVHIVFYDRKPESLSQQRQSLSPF
jgi:hypothetical protein